MSTPVAPVSFPHSLTVQVSLEIEVTSQDDIDYLVDSNNSVQPGFIADLYDTLQDQLGGGILKINDKSFTEIQKILQQNLTSP